jgi:hypothetical protein
MSDKETGRELTAAEQAAFTAWAELIERDDYEPRPSGQGVALEGDEAAAYSRALLAELGVTEEPAPEPAGRGRRKVGGSGKGESPKRQVRLPEDLDAKLAERAEHDHAAVAAVMRDAIDFYLTTPPTGLAFVAQLKKLDPAPFARRAQLAQSYAARLLADHPDAELSGDDRRELADVLRTLGSLAAFEAKTLHNQSSLTRQ